MIYIVLPAYNEELTIQPLLESLASALRGAGLRYRAIAVNDGSSDGTGAVLERASHSMPVTLVNHPQNRGLAETLKTGFRVALKSASDDDVIVVMDADNTHPAGLIGDMSAMIAKGNDVVVASRYRAGAEVVGVPWHRRFLSFGASVLFRTLFPIRGVRDYTSGYRAYRAALVRRMFEAYGDALISGRGFSCTADLLLKIRKHGAAMAEVPLVLRYDLKAGGSKMNVARTIAETLKLVIKRL